MRNLEAILDGILNSQKWSMYSAGHHADPESTLFIRCQNLLYLNLLFGG